MADKLISVKIDVTKIDKSKLFKGEKGTYLNATIFWNDVQDQYNSNGFISQDVTKEERAAGLKGAILGNVKLAWVNQGEAKDTPVKKEVVKAEPYSDGLPF